ncbi:MAG TPA: DUF1801 domain-containing protein [Bacteroidales bacterium]|nr:DUF1801 domain-containing protein [Bacteroidales bacterium]
MQIHVNTPEEYINQIPDNRKEALKALRKIILENIPEGFAETINYGMIGYVVPHSIYPKGYHVDSAHPLPFINIASQKNYIVLYHMGLYSNKELLDWFIKEYTIETKSKPDMGKGCLRFKKPDQIPFRLIGELVAKITVDDWIGSYERNRSKPS